MSTHNFYQTLREAFPADLSRTAVYAAERNYSWREIDETSARLANWLGSLGIPCGSRIAVQVEKSVEAMMLYLATLRAGHVFLPLNTAYQSGEITYFIDNAQPAVLVCSPGNRDWVEPLGQQAGVQHIYTLGDDGSGTLLPAAAAQSATHTPFDVQPQDLAVIIYTSGTTGRSKGAMLSHGNIRSNAQVLQQYWGWNSDDVLIHALPIFHVHGLFAAIHGALINGSPMIWMNKFDPKQAIAHMAKATVFMGVPTLYTRMLVEATLTAQSTAHMRLFVSGSAPMLVETHQQWRDRTGHTILERYGMSETVMLTSNPCQADDRFAGSRERRIGTVGFPLPGVSLRVVGEEGQVLGTDEIGGIQVKGPNVFAGYWQMPEKTAEEFTADGFFKTGDVGKVDADGYVTIVGRSKDLIISGGYNVYPAEVESYLNNLPGVAESAVVGAPHPDFGEVGVAVVVPKAGAQLDPQALIQALKQQLANYKVPKHCEIASDLPRNTMGKVQKNLLRNAHADRFVKA